MNEQLPLLQGHIYAKLSQSYVINTSTCSYHLQVRFLCSSHPAREPRPWVNTNWRIDGYRCDSKFDRNHQGRTQDWMQNVLRMASLRFNEHLHKFLSYPSCWQITFKQKLLSGAVSWPKRLNMIKAEPPSPRYLLFFFFRLLLLSPSSYQNILSAHLPPHFHRLISLRNFKLAPPLQCGFHPWHSAPCLIGYILNK